MRRFLVVFAVVVYLLLVDAVTKELAEARLMDAPVAVVDGYFDLAYVQNRGCAWGLFQGSVWPLAMFAAFTLVFLIWNRRAFFEMPKPPEGGRISWFDRLGAVAEPLLYAGILGNLIDRVFRGYVIDFLDFHWRASHFPCFNVADVCITVAAGLLLVASFRTSGK